MIVQQANVDDAEEILALQKLCYLSEAEIYSDYTIPPLVDTLDMVKCDFEKYFFLKVTKEGKIIASVRGKISSPGNCYIGRLIVHPDFQNQGIGTKLMSEIEKIFHKCHRWELMTGHLSNKNIKLYKKCGYEIFKTEKLTSHLTLVFMEKIRKKHI